MMARKLYLGVFLPVTNNGWIISKNSPQFLPSFGLNRSICQRTESALSSNPIARTGYSPGRPSAWPTARAAGSSRTSPATTSPSS